MKDRELLLISYMFQEKILNNFMRCKYQERRRKAGTDRENTWREVDRKKKRGQSQSRVKTVRWNVILQWRQFRTPLLDVCVVHTYVTYIHVSVNFSRKTAYQY